MLGLMILYLLFLGTLVFFLFTWLTFKVVEGAFIRSMGNPNYGFYVLSGIIAFFSIITILLGGKSGIPVLFIIVVTYVIFLIIKKNEIQQEKNRVKRMIENLENRLNLEPDDFGTLMALGKLYEKEEDYRRALFYYEKAEKLVAMAEESLAKRKAKEMRYFIKTEEEEKPVICPGCGKRNAENAVFCRKCGKVLRTPVQVWREMNKYAKILIMILGFQYILFAIFFSWKANLLLWIFTLIDLALFYSTFREA